MSMPKQTFLNLEEKKRLAILEAAFEEFSNHPYNEASINTIIEKSNISKGSLYQYFEDKKDLYLYLIELAGEIKLQYLHKYDSSLSFDDFFEGFAALMNHGVAFNLANPLYSNLLKSAYNGPLIDESMAKMKQMNAVFMDSLIRTAIEKKQIRSDVDPALIVYVLNALTTEFSKYVAVKANSDIPSAIDALMDLIKNGLTMSAQKNKER
jgi:AcrR family transcriptional regulator